MHFQSGVSNWPTALVKMPDGALIKSVDNPGLLREAKQTWQAAGRDPAELFTLYRHHNVSTAEGDWQAALAHWRRMFARWVDRTYLEQYAPFVDMVSEANEYSATSTWTNPADKAKVLQNVRAAVTVWNSEYRGKVVRSADGGEGLIPAGCRLALLAGPVGNDIPREIYQLAVSEDSPIDYHAYCHCQNGQRSPFDWIDHSGRAFRHEQAYGIKPRYVFGESGPYLGVFEGWRHPQVLGGDVTALVAVMRAWVRDMQQTPAYREGRIIGPGAWFTSGGGEQWRWYALETPELSALADMLRDEWKPGESDPVTNVPNEVLKKVDGLAAQIRAELAPYLEPAPWWEAWPAGVLDPTRKVKAPPAPLALYDKPDGLVVRTITDGRTMDVFERAGAWLRVTKAAPIFWCKAAEVTAL